MQDIMGQLKEPLRAYELRFSLAILPTLRMASKCI